jgi:hypothetical protein
MKWIVALLLVAVMGCGGSNMADKVDIYSDYDGDPALSDYGTWDYTSYVGLGPFSQDRRFRERIHDIVLKNLEAQGLEYKPGDPDLRVGYYLAAEVVDVDEVRQVYVEYTPEFDSALRQLDQGSLSIFIFDSKTGQQIWRATAEGKTDKSASLKKRKENMVALVEALMAELP